MLKDLPVEEFGPAINIREYSFLNNPLLPQQVNEYQWYKFKLFLFYDLLRETLVWNVVSGKGVVA